MITPASGLDIEPAPRRTLPDEATERLRTAITTGKLKSGEKINEAKIADMLQISRSPLREALASLAANGLITKIANRGAFVVNYSLDDINEICTFRAVLEIAAVRLIIKRQGTDLAKLAEIVAEMGDASSSGNAEVVVSMLDLRFHAALIAAAGNKRLFHAWNNLRSHLQVLLYSRNIINNDFRSIAVTGHREILNALQQRDEALATRTMQEHLDYSYNCLHQAKSGDAHETSAARN